MGFIKNYKNISVIDTMMFDFEHYMSAYIVEGRELAIVDTGLPNQLPTIISSIEKHGYCPRDISYIFLTHCEHPDHAGNVAPLLEMSPKAQVCINPVGLRSLTEPEIEEARREATISSEQCARFGCMEPVPRNRIRLINNKDVIDLGNDQRLKFFFTSAHQPSGYVILDEKNKGMFINDLAGVYLADADYCLSLHPPGSDFFQEIETLKMIMEMPIEILYLSHYGIHDKPKELIGRSLNRMQNMIDIGLRCLAKAKPEEISNEIDAINRKEAEKLLSARGREMYEFATNEHIPPQARNFAELFLQRYGSESSE